MKAFTLLIYILVFSIISDAQISSIKSFSLSATGDQYTRSVITDASGNIYITGAFSNTVDFDNTAGTYNLTSLGGTDAFLAKYNSSLQLQWAKDIGGTGTDEGYALSFTNSGNILLAGRFSGTADLDPNAGTANVTSAGGVDMFFGEYDVNGAYVWAKAIGSTDATGDQDIIADIKSNASGDIFICGSFDVGSMDADPGAGTATLTNSSGYSAGNIFFGKYSSTGSYIFAKSLNGCCDAASGLVIDAAGNIIMTGGFQGTLDFDPDAGTQYLFAAYYGDIWLGKYSGTTGALIWAKSIYGPNQSDWAEGIAQDVNGDVYITGEFSPTSDFDMGPGVYNLTGTDLYDLFIAKYTTDGNFVWAKSMPGVSTAEARSIAVNNTGKLAITGYFNNTIDFDPSGATFNLTSSGNSDIFYAVYDTTGNFITAGKGGSINYDDGLDICITDGNKIIFVGDYYSDNFTIGNTTLNNGGAYDAYITTFDICAPTINCISNQTRNTAFGQCTYTASGTEFNPSANSNCFSISMTNDYNSSYSLNGAVFNRGTTIVIWTATDGNSNTATCSMTVTVIDNEAPTISCTGNITISTSTCTASTTLINPTASDNCLNLGNALNFDGVNDYVDLPGTPILGNTFTVETWIYSENATGDGFFHGFIGYPNSADPLRAPCMYVYDGTKIHGGFGDGTNWCSFVTGDVISPNTWYHLALTFDGTTMKLYVNGDLAFSTNAYSGHTPQNVNAITSLGMLDNAYQGSLDEVRIWNIARTQSQIKANMNKSLSAQANLISLFHFDQGTSGGNNNGETTLKDASGIGNNGSLNGFALNSSSSNWVGGALTTPYLTNNAPAQFNLGINSVIWTATDGSDNTATCSLTVTVIDNQVPTITCLNNQTRYASAGNCTYSVNGSEFDPTFGDNCTGATISNNFNTSNTLANSVFNKGTTTIIWTVTDLVGNSSSCSFALQVIDNQAPTLTCPGNQTKSTNTGVCTYTVSGTEFDPDFGDNCTGLVITNDYAAGNSLADKVFNKGNTTVVWTATDASGNTATCSFTVTVNDDEAPTITCFTDQTRSTNSGTCTYTALGTEFDPGFGDNCSGTTIANDYATGSSLSGAVFQKGSTTVVWTAIDASGNTSTCSFIVTINDNEAPTITCVGNQTRSTNTGVCTYTATGTEFDPDFSDNCTGTTIANDYASGSSLSGMVFQKGTTTVVWTATDASGNTSTCSFTLTINDTEAPTITCVGNQTRSTNTEVCTYTDAGTEFDPAFSDNCTGTTIANDYATGSSLSGMVFQKGTTTVVWTATDASGNTSTCSFTVTINDTEAPTITCVGNQTRSTNTGVCTYTATGTEFDPDFGDNCTGTTIANDYATGSSLSGAVFEKGTTNVVWTVTDASNNSSTCSISVSVKDNEAPTITCVGNQTKSMQIGTCSYTVSGSEFDPVYADNCTGSTVSNNYNNTATLSNSQFNKGITTVIWTATDASGNNNSCSFTVTISDNETPTIMCIGNQSRFTEFGICSYMARGTEFDPFYGDNCTGATVTNNITHTSSLNSISLNKGLNSIVWTITDASGNTATCGFTVTVVDNQYPTLQCLNKNRNANTGACSYTTVGGEFDPTFSDNCPGALLRNNINSSSSLSGQIFSKGANTVIWTATDADGHNSTCSQIITVVDNQAPTIVCAGNQTRYAASGGCSYSSINGEFDPISISDNCPGTIILRNDRNGSTTLPSTAFVIGNTTITWTATDASGNKATCNITITVIDNQAPTINCPGNKIRSADVGSNSYTVVGNEMNPLGYSDNCLTNGGVSLSNSFNSQSSLAGASVPKGLNTIVWTATDNSGNTATCSFTVTVNDNEVPTITCISNKTKSTEQGACTYIVSGSEFNPAFADNCSGSIITNNYNAGNSLNGESFSQGTTTVVWKVTDASGNTATCSFSVTVIDNVPPTINYISNQTRSTGANGCTYTAAGTEFDPTYSDNCTGVNIRNNYATGTSLAGKLFNKGITTVVWTVTDASNNTSTQSFTVTVRDVTPPSITCISNQTKNAPTGLCYYTAVGSEFDPVYSDNCTGAVITNNYATGSSLAGKTFGQGVTTVTWTVTDASGNTTTCSRTITVYALGTAPTCSLSAKPNSTVNTGGIATNLYIGYGPTADTLIATATGGSSFAYLWTGSTYLSNPTSQKALFTPTSAVNVTLTCRVTNECGYQTTCTITICVKDIRDVNNSANIWLCHKTTGLLTATFTDASVATSTVTTHLGHGDKLGRCNQVCGGVAKTAANEMDVISLGTESQELDLIVKPNPYNEAFTLSYVSKSSEQATINVYDMAGKLVESTTVTGIENSVSLGRNLEEGMYTVVFTQGNERKVIKVSKIKQ